MKKHQFIKTDCNCPRRATYFTCRHCGVIEHGSIDEIRGMSAMRAVCTGEDAPDASPVESFKSKMGGVVDCLAPDYDTWQKEEQDGKAASDTPAE